MCDTLLAKGIISELGNLIFAKNSDREPLEAHQLLHIPRKTHSAKTLNCTYLQIPQTSTTWEAWLFEAFSDVGCRNGRQ